VATINSIFSLVLSWSGYFAPGGGGGGGGHIWDNGTRTGKISMLVCFLLKSMEPVGKIFTSSD
jgi:hypothetical protein